MKKGYIFGIVIISLILIVVGIYMFLNRNIQEVRTEKEVYVQGKIIPIHYLYEYTSYQYCDGNIDFKIYKKLNETWKEQIAGPDRETWLDGCVNGSLKHSAFRCDYMVNHKPERIEINAVYDWDQKVLERTSDVTSCGGISASEITNGYNQEIPNYEYVNAGPGQYKIVYGKAEKIITIVNKCKEGYIIVNGACTMPDGMDWLHGVTWWNTSGLQKADIKRYFEVYLDKDIRDIYVKNKVIEDSDISPYRIISGNNIGTTDNTSAVSRGVDIIDNPYVKGLVCISTGKSPEIIVHQSTGCAGMEGEGCGGSTEIWICDEQFFIHTTSSSFGPEFYGPYYK